MSAKRIVLVTGGNTGLGLEIVRALCKSAIPYEIIMGSRSLAKAEAAIKEVEAEGFVGSTNSLSAVQVDVDSDDSITRAYESIAAKHDKLDILVNNAGASYDSDHHAGRITMREAWNKAWNTNVAGTHVMTHTFVPLLLKSDEPRIIFMTSGLSTLTETMQQTSTRANAAPAKGWPKSTLSHSAYRSSKTGMNMMMREWTRILKNDGVKVIAVSPGLLATNLGGQFEWIKQIGGLPPARGAEVVRGAVEGERDDHLGEVVRADFVQSW